MADGNWNGSYADAIIALSKARRTKITIDGKEIPYYWGESKLYHIVKNSPTFSGIVKTLNEVVCTEISEISRTLEEKVFDIVGPNGLVYIARQKRPIGYGGEVTRSLKKPKRIYTRLEPSTSRCTFTSPGINPWTGIYTSDEYLLVNKWNSVRYGYVMALPQYKGSLIRLKGIPRSSSDDEVYLVAVSLIHETGHFYLWYQSRKEVIAKTNHRWKVPEMESEEGKSLQEFLDAYITDEIQARELEAKCTKEIWESFEIPQDVGPPSELKAIYDFLMKGEKYTNRPDVERSLGTERFPVTYVERFLLNEVKRKLSRLVEPQTIDDTLVLLGNALIARYHKPNSSSRGKEIWLPDQLLDKVDSWNRMYELLEDSIINEVSDSLGIEQGRTLNLLLSILLTEIVISERWSRDKRIHFFDEEEEKKHTDKVATEHLSGYFGSSSLLQLSKEISYSQW